MGLFQLGNFSGAAGHSLPWKIECDWLTREDWDCIAAAAAPRLPKFKDVWGVPKGGLILADAMVKYAVKTNIIGLPPLIVDDVWTTGTSMTTFTSRALGLGPRQWNGFVAFSRAAALPDGITAFMQLGFKP